MTVQQTPFQKRPLAHWSASTLPGGIDDLCPPVRPGLIERLTKLLTYPVAIGEPVPTDWLSESGLDLDIALWRKSLFEGTGVVLVRNLPIADWGEDATRKVFWAIGHGLGRPVSQSRKGDVLGDITKLNDDPKERGYRSGRALNMHTDSDDVVGMLCLRQGASGGESHLVSAYAIEDYLTRTQPEVIDALRQGFRYDWNNEEPAGEPPITDYAIPALGLAPDGSLQTCFLSNHIERAHDKLGTLSEHDLNALSAFKAAADHPDLRLEYSLAAGDLVFIDNLSLLHGRNAFEDTPERRRLILRLWLVAKPKRSRHPAIARFYGDGGIEENG